MTLFQYHHPASIYIYPLLAYCKLRKIPFILWGHGGSRKRNVSQSGALKDRIHRFLIRNADAYICYTEAIKNELARATESEKLFVANNTLDTETLFRIKKQLEIVGREKIKGELGLGKKFYMCFIGRLLESKRVDQAIEVLRILQRNIPDTGLIIIGDGPERERLESFVAKEKAGDVIFVGEISDWEVSGKYLYCSNLMIIPQSAGLAINHAFSFGLPVITQRNATHGPFHGPEIEYVIEGKTGFKCENGNLEQMSTCAEQIINNENHFVATVDNYCRKNLGIDSMVDGMHKAIHFAFSCH